MCCSASTPDHFICPLTLDVMENPVVHKVTGITYSRGAILEWIYFGKATCPLTRIPLHPSDFQANTALQMEIDQWKAKNGIAEDDLDASSQFSVESEACAECGQPPLARDFSHLMKLRNKVLQNRDARLQTMLQAC